MRSLRRPFVWIVPFVAVLLVSPIATVSRALESSGTIPADEVPQLIRQLDANTRAERLAAENRLLELGPAVLPLLPPPELLPSAAVRDSVTRIRVTLEQRLARESVQPSRITLTMTASIAEQLQSLAHDSGNKIIVDDLNTVDRARRMETSLQETPFWQALDDFCSAAGLRYQLDERVSAIRIQSLSGSTAAKEAAVANAGTFRVAALDPHIRAVAGSDRHLLRVPLRIMAEPRLQPLFLQFAVAEMIAGTSRGGRLPPFSPDAKYELPLTEKGRRAAAVDIDFLLPSETTTDRITLNGKLTVTTAAGSEAIVFSNLRQAAKQKNVAIARRRGGVTVTLERVSYSVNKQNQSEVVVRITVAYDRGGPAFESHRSWLLHNDVFLSRGNERILPQDFETTLQENGQVGIQYRFIGGNTSAAATAPDETFTYVAPTLLIDVPVAFELKDIRVPIR